MSDGKISGPESVPVDKSTETYVPKHSPPSKATPWWESKVLIGLLGGMVTTIVPLTAGVQAWVSKQQDRAIEQQKQQHALEMEYVDRAIDSTKSAYQRKHMLEFLVKTAEVNSLLAAWATGVLKDVSDEISTAVAERDRKSKEEELVKAAKVDAETDMRTKTQAVIDIKAGHRTKSAEDKQKLQELETARKAAEDHAATLANKLVVIQANLAGLEQKLRTDTPAPASNVPVPITVRLLQVRPLEDGTLLRTRWTFRVLVNGQQATSVPSDLYTDWNGDARALHQSGNTVAISSRPIDIQIVGIRDHGGVQAEGNLQIPWDSVGQNPATVRVQVPGDPKKGRFDFQLLVQRQPGA